MNAFQHKLINQSGLFNEADKKALEHLFLIISSRESDPIFPHYLPDLAVACLALESISTNNQCLIYPQGLQVLIRESHQNYAIISGKKKHGSISAEKYPTFKLLLEESDKRPSFIQMLTRLMVWDWVLSLNFQPTSKGKVVKALLQDNQLIDFTIKASEFLDSTQLCLDQSFLLLVGKLRNWCRNAQKTKIEKYTADTLTKFINALFKRYEEIKQSDFKSVYDQLPTLTDSKNTEDQPISIDLRNLRRTTSSPTETKKQDELEDDPLEPPSIESIPNDILKKSSRYQNGYAKTAIHRTSQQAQFLDNANQVLTELESQHFFDKLLHDSSDVATQILITFCTGSEPMFWCDWKLHQSEHTEWVDIKNGIWGTPVFIGDKNLIPEPEVAQLFQPTQPVFARPIPQELNDRLNALCKPNNSTLGELFTGTAIEISETCDQWIKQNNPFGRNISLARIRNHLYHQIMLQSFDEAKATHIIGQRVHKIPQSLTYTTFSTEDLISSYQKALPQLNFSYTKIDKTFIGSKAFIKEAEIVTLLEEIANRCIASKKTLTKNPILNTQYLIEFHNQFVSYITLFGLIITSHRPTKDPFARVIDFVFDINATLICDKIVDEKHLSRVCFFDDNFKKQVLTYIEHLKQLQKIFSPKEESDPANSLESIFDINNSTVPFLFFLHKVENSVIVESVQPLSLRNQLSTINSLWESIPLNFGRHYLASKLRTLNVNPEYINYQLGHISAGEEPYGSNSTLSPKIVSKTLQPALTKISTYLNLKPLIGLDDLTKIVISDPIEKVICPTISLAPISRIEKYQETAKEELAIALDIYNTKIRWLDNDFDNALFQTIANDAIQQVIKRSRLRVVENLRFISTCLKEKAKIHNWHFEAPINLLKIDIESQPFDYRQFKDWHQVNDIKLKLKQHLTNKNFASSSYSELLTLFFISVMLHTHLTSKNRLEKLLEALINEHYYFYEGRIYFELATRENQIQRIAIDLTSALLFNRLLESSAKELSFKQLLLRIRNFLKKEFDIDPSTFQSGIELDAHLFIPSALVAVQTGDRKIASISKASLLRINSKQRLIENAPETTENKFDKEVINLSSGITPLSSKFNLETQLKSIRLFSQPLLSNNKILRKDLKAKLKLAFDSEIKPNEDLADITKVLCIWLISRIDAPGLRKSELAFKTINNYFKLFASLLMEHIQDKKIQSFSSDELIDIYNQILISQPPEYQANTAHQLFSFHQKVCCELYRLDEIEMDDLSFESDESDPRIKATLVMPWEVEKASLTLDKSIDTSHLKIQSQAILSLYSRLGFRPSELMDIDPKDVKSQYISIRWNRLGGLKRPQSFRSAFFNEKFGEPEHKNLNACVKLHASSKAIKFKRFWITNFQTSEQEKHLFLNTINGVLKNVTGDSQVNIYSLRHSIATIEIMNYFANILDFEGIEHELRERFQLEHYYPKGFSSFMKKCFSHTLPSRRHLYRTGRSLGHQTAKTSLTNYSHFYEFVMPFYFVEEFGSEFNKMLVNLSGKTDDAIKSLRKREKNPLRLSEQLVAQIARKQEHIINLKNVEKHYLTQRQPALFRIKNQSFALSPTLLYQALIFLTENPTPDSQMLINRYMINDEQLTLIKGKYHEMYLLTGFDPFCFKADLENDTSALEDQERVFKLKDSFGLLDKSLNPEMLDLWSRYHDPQRPFWHFETKEQLKEFTTLLQQAGVPNDHIFIGTDLKQQNGLHSEIDGILYRYCKFATAKPIPRMQSPSLLTDQPGVVLSASVDKKAPFLNKQLNLIFFVKILFSKIFE